MSTMTNISNNILSNGGSRSGLLFKQINLHKSRAPMMELMDTEFDVALVQEPNITKGGTVALVDADKTGFCKGAARAAVIVSRRLNFWPIETMSTKDLAVVALELETPNKQLYIASCYLDILHVAPSTELVRIVQHCKETRTPLVIGIDSNAHSVMWGEPHTNGRGEAIEEWVIRNDLTVVNRGAIPTFAPANDSRRSIIDITIVNHWAESAISNWEVDQKTVVLSDHRLICFHMSHSARIQDVLLRSYKKADWNLFHYCITRQDTISILDEIDDVDVVDVDVPDYACAGTG